MMTPLTIRLEGVSYDPETEDESFYPIGTLEWKETTMDNEHATMIYEVGNQLVGTFVTLDEQTLMRYLQELGDDFCWDLVVYQGEVSIGTVSFNRLFVETLENLVVYLDNEAPNSLVLGNHLQSEAFEQVQGRYIGLLDELILEKAYEAQAEWVASLMVSFLREANQILKLYRVYALPKFPQQDAYLKGVASSQLWRHYECHGFKHVVPPLGANWDTLLEWNIMNELSPGRKVTSPVVQYLLSDSME